MESQALVEFWCVEIQARSKPMQRVGIVLTGTLASMFPDMDAISLSSRFDRTFGRLLGLEHSGRVIYSSKFWYSHHAFLHSMVASVLFACLFISGILLAHRLRASSAQSLSSYFRKNIALWLAFVLGYWMHLAGDLPTPGSVWGGINLLWPAKSYVGGFGKIWWWNNYDIFLIVFAALLANSVMLTISTWRKRSAMLFCSIVVLLSLIAVCIQINSRHTDYAYSGNTPNYEAFESQSKKEQDRILGHRLYGAMSRLDGWVRVNF